MTFKYIFSNFLNINILTKQHRKYVNKMNQNSRKIIIFITTASKKEAEKIAGTLVKEKLAACCNIIDSVSSIFRWKGKICNENELLLIVKSSSELFNEIVKKVKAMHSYDVPEIIALPIIDGSDDYLKWIDDEINC